MPGKYFAGHGLQSLRSGRPRRSSILEEQVNEERGRGPPPFCLGGWRSRGWTQPLRRNGRPVRLFTPIFRFFGISSIGLPLFGFRLLKKSIVTFGPFFSFTSREYSVHPWYVYGMFDLVPPYTQGSKAFPFPYRCLTRTSRQLF